MDSETENYVDPDAPLPRPNLHLLACIIVGVAILVACYLWNRYVPSGP